MAGPTSVDEYLDSFDDAQRSRLGQLRELCRRYAPEATERLKWGSPAYWTETILFVFSGHKHHMNLVFTPSTKEAFASELKGFDTGKGSIKIPYDTEIPTALLERMIAHRIREFEVDGVKWM